MIKQNLRHLRRFAGARGRFQDNARTPPECGNKIVFEFKNGEVAPVHLKYLLTCGSSIFGDSLCPAVPDVREARNGVHP